MMYQRWHSVPRELIADFHPLNGGAKEGSTLLLISHLDPMDFLPPVKMLPTY